jgi:hypothetical protein
MGVKELNNQLFIKSQKILKEIEEKKDIFIFTNSTVDGLICGSIIFKSIFNNFGNATLRCFTEKIEKSIDEIFNEKHDFYIFIDFNSNIIDRIKTVFDKNSFLFISSDSISKPEINTAYENILNPWLYNVDGQKEINCAGLAYFLIKNFDRKSNEIAYLPIISALSKNQDIGEDKSFIGLNYEILQSILKLNVIEQRKSLDISEVETMPIINMLENNTNHYIKEITWNKNTSLKIIKESQVQISTIEGNIRVLKDLDEKEFTKIYETIIKFLQENSKINNSKIVKDILYGFRYILNNEEDEGYLKNAKTFVKVIELCIREQKNALALSICLGDRSGGIINQVHEIITKHNNLIKKISSHLFAEKWRFYDDKETIFINGEGVIEPNHLDSFIIFLEKSISFADRLICLRIVDSEEYYRLIITKSKFSDFDLTKIREKIEKKLYENGDIEKESITVVDKDKLEIKISTSNLEDFLSNIKKIIINEKVSRS